MLNLFTDMDQRKFAKVAGLMYLLLIVLGIGGQVVRMGFIEPDDATETANNIMANEIKFAAANVVWLISEMVLLFLGLALYFALKPVNKTIAQLMVIFIVVGVAIESINTLNQFAALQLVSGADYLTVYSTEQLHAQVMFRLDLYEAGYNIAAIMSFGPWLIPAAFLLYTSGYYHKLIGIFALMGGLGILIEGLRYFLLPDNEVITPVAGVVAVIGEFVVCGWLILIGAKIPSNDAYEESEEEKVEAITETEPEEKKSEVE